MTQQDRGALDAALNSALRFSASHSAITADQEKQIRAIWNRRLAREDVRPEGASAGGEGEVTQAPKGIITADTLSTLSPAPAESDWSTEGHSPECAHHHYRDFCDCGFGLPEGAGYVAPHPDLETLCLSAARQEIERLREALKPLLRS